MFEKPNPLKKLEARLGAERARRRLALEQAAEPRVFGGGLNFFHPENWYSGHALLRGILKLTGLYWRGRRNTRRFVLEHNALVLPRLPRAFEGFRILHLTDLHTDMQPGAIDALCDRLGGIDYDLCVLTGDFRAWTFGDIEPALTGMKRLRRALRGAVYAVLGNHDSITMVPGLEEMGIRVLLNESVAVERGGARIHLAGIDDAHYHQAHDIRRALRGVPRGGVSILLSHTPEVYREAADSGADVLLCGHTHGGQICLPGGIPLTIDSDCPRHLAAGRWHHGRMQGYTSRGAGTSGAHRPPSTGHAHRLPSTSRARTGAPLATSNRNNAPSSSIGLAPRPAPGTLVPPSLRPAQGGGNPAARPRQASISCG